MSSTRTGGTLDEVDELRSRLEAAERTIAVLMDRAERALMAAAPEDVALQQAIAGLETTLRQQAESPVVAQADYRKLFDAHPDGLLLLDPRWRVRACNDQAAQLLERSVSELAGSDLRGWLEEADGTLLGEVAAVAVVGWSHRVVSLKEGRSLTLGWCALDDGDRLVSLRSMSEAHRLGEELSQARRLAGVGRLAGDLVRALADPLAMVDMSHQLLAQLELPTPAHAMIAKARRDLGSVADIARDLLAFVEVGELQQIEEPVRAVVADVILELERRRPGAQVDLEELPRGASLRGDPERVRQILLHLLVHSLDGAPGARPVVLSVERTEDSTLFRVRRPGRGLSAAERDRRSPLAGEGGQGRADGMGFSLGLAWMLTQQLGGTLTAADAPVDGAIYTVRLPHLLPVAEVQIEAEGRTVVLVDDDPLLGPALLAVLEEDGYRALLTDSAEGALGLLAAGGVDALVADISLPGMDGETLVEIVRSRHPAVGARVLVMSGRLSSPRLDCPYLQKPFAPDALRAAVASLFETPQP